MRVSLVVHSLASCWNNGNAHFLRGVARALAARGHAVTAWEPADGWSRANLLAERGEPATIDGIEIRIHGPEPDACTDADLVIVHEWNEPALVAAIGRARARGGRFSLLFHDTHHRAVSDPDAIRAFDLSGYDGVLAFGETLADIYRRWGWGDRVHVWHEAADITLFRPPAIESDRQGVVWIGNFGDGERGEELVEFLLAPARDAGLPLDVHGVRYPPEALGALASHGARYRGWLANAAAPAIFAHHLATVHVPRRQYARRLPGIPTIRVFEALACAIPLVSAPWDDREHLFGPDDFLRARDGREMTVHLRALAADPALRRTLAANGLATIRARHTCDHRAAELLDIAARLRAPRTAPQPVGAA